MPNPTAHHAFKGLQDWIEVFRAGSHVDSKGTACAFTTADLDQMAANVALGAPPAVLGHPKHNDPAYAWGREVKREGESLFMKFADINPAFEAGVDSGAYRNRSVSVVKDKTNGWRIRHVGWLGAAPPAIDGLQPLDYTAEPEALEFSAEAPAWDTGYALQDVASALRGLRDHLIATAGIEAADAAVPDWRITSISDAASRIRATPDDDAMPGIRPFSAHQGADTMLTQEDLDRTARETEARVRAEIAAAQANQTAEFTAATELANRLLRERQTERIAGQINGWKAAGQLLPAEEPGLAEFMAQLEGAPGGTAATFEFMAAGAAADAPKVKKTPADYFAEFMARRGPLVKLGAKAGSETDPGAGDVVKSFTAQPGYEGLTVDGDRAALDQRIKQYQAEHKCDYAAAAAAVMVIGSKA